jgi:hypothetical protein
MKIPKGCHDSQSITPLRGYKNNASHLKSFYRFGVFFFSFKALLQPLE